MISSGIHYPLHIGYYHSHNQPGKIFHGLTKGSEHWPFWCRPLQLSSFSSIFSFAILDGSSKKNAWTMRHHMLDFSCLEIIFIHFRICHCKCFEHHFTRTMRYHKDHHRWVLVMVILHDLRRWMSSSASVPRHSTMIVGPTGGGKSVVLNCLAEVHWKVPLKKGSFPAEISAPKKCFVFS